MQLSAATGAASAADPNSSSLHLDNVTLRLPSRQLSYPSPLPDYSIMDDQSLQLQGFGVDTAAGTAGLAGMLGADLLLGGLTSEPGAAADVIDNSIAGMHELA